MGWLRAHLGRSRRGLTRLTGSNLLQLGVTVAVAVLIAVAGVLSSEAADRWQSMVRLNTKRSAALLENTTYVYGVKAAPALNAALLSARARFESGRYRHLVTRLLSQSDRAALTGLRRYRGPDGSFDLARMVADAQRPFDHRANPDVALKSGDARRREAMIVVLLVVPLLVAYLVTEFVVRRRRRSASTLASVDVSPAPTAPTGGSPDRVPRDEDRDGGEHQPNRDSQTEAQGDTLDLVPRPWSVPSTRRVGTTIALIAWLGVSLLAVAQVAYSNSAERSQAIANRKTVDLSTTIAASDTRLDWGLSNVRQTAIDAVDADDQALAAERSGDRAASPTSLSQARALERSAQVSERIELEMDQPPTLSDGADAFTVNTLSGGDIGTEANAQSQAVDDANTAGKRSTRISIAILLAGLALSVSALASVRATRVKPIDAAAGCMLAVALLTAGSVFLI